MTDDTDAHSPSKTQGAGSGPKIEDAAKDEMARRQTLELVRACSAITDADVNKRIADTVKAIARISPKD